MGRVKFVRWGSAAGVGTVLVGIWLPRRAEGKVFWRVGCCVAGVSGGVETESGEVVVDGVGEVGVGAAGVEGADAGLGVGRVLCRWTKGC